MELKLIKKIQQKGFRTRRIYEINFYKVEETDFGDGKPVVNVYIDNGIVPFLPTIETVYDFNDESITDFKINPAAYGSLSCEDIELMINSLNIAIETAKTLIKKYVK